MLTEIFQNNGVTDTAAIWTFVIVSIILIATIQSRGVWQFFSIIAVTSFIGATYYFLLIIFYTLYMPYLIKFGLCLTVCMTAAQIVKIK